MSNNKYSDTKTLGNSKICPFVPGESSQDRHYRRKKTNTEYIDKLKKWCKEKQIEFKVNNNGEHWIFKKGRNCLEWWPSSAKTVINHQWKKGIHCNDYAQLMELVEQRNLFSA